MVPTTPPAFNWHSPNTMSPCLWSYGKGIKMSDKPSEGFQNTGIPNPPPVKDRRVNRSVIPSAFCLRQQRVILRPPRCSQQVNATQEEHNVITVTLFSPLFGKTEVESRVNISRGRFSTLECVATVEGEQAYTLFSISGKS